MTAYISSRITIIPRTSVPPHSIPYYIPCQFYFLCFHMRTHRMITPSLVLTAHAHLGRHPSVPFFSTDDETGQDISQYPARSSCFLCNLFLLSVCSGYPLFLLSARTPAASTAAAAAAAANGSTFAVSPVLTDFALEFCDPAVFPAVEVSLSEVLF